MKQESPELAKWNEAQKDFQIDRRIVLGSYWTYVLKNTPRRMLFTLSHYKFAAKMIGPGKNILEVGCNEGLGTLLLAENANKVVGIDIDAAAIQAANENFSSDIVEFYNRDILGNCLGQFDGVVSLDVIEHIYPQNEALYFESICNNLSANGLCVIGTPNAEAEKYSNEMSRKAHVNVYSWDRLQASMEKYFQRVFLFSANDELIHTGFYPMAHYFIGVGVGKKV